MKLLRFLKQEKSPPAPTLMTEEMRRRLSEAEDQLTKALSDHSIKMDWARRIAQDTLKKLDEGHAK